MNHTAPHSNSSCLTLSILASVALVALAATQWWLVEPLTPFGLAFVWLMTVGAIAVAAIWSARRFRFRDWRTGVPLLICLLATLAWWFTPFTRFWVAANWKTHRQAREQVVAKVLDGSIRPNKPCCPGLIALGPEIATVSAGGNEIAVEEHAGRKYVFFYTFRGILDRYSGSLFVSSGGDPREFADLADPPTEVRPGRQTGTG